ncbi:DUF1353 domain-containing protein [Duganella sp. BJB476]|uniref:DUF1353 domain-containing protein n=1 Tax=Duganella sp. BJB476 TaxID=1871176 RepID=UPI000E349368|nr:DUF1353 domain-containing protein [Duganella sp. BJB476]RFP32406.1 DUF1353 domain-containing protein [Duganella sp. BJB476]
MSRFLTKLQLEVADNTDDGKWVLTAALIYQSDVAGRTFVVPRGFQTDLASVPRLPVIFLLTGDTSNQAAAVHDYLYSSHEVTREMADAVLREASEVTGVPAWRRWLMWAGVRAGGASHWEPAGT